MKRPIEFYQDAWTLFNDDLRIVPGYQKAIDAFEASAIKHNTTLSGCMTNKSQALSHMKDDVKRKVEYIKGSELPSTIESINATRAIMKQPALNIEHHKQEIIDEIDSMIDNILCDGNQSITNNIKRTLKKAKQQAVAFKP